jgi:hypothetical protein
MTPTRQIHRLFRNEPARGAARSAEYPGEQRSESLAGPRSGENGAEDMPAEFAPIKDRAETEQMKVAASAASTLDDYGAAEE